MKNWNKKLGYVICAALVVGASAYAGNKSEIYTGSMKSIPHLTIKFDADSAVLSNSDKADLGKIVQDARNTGAIDQVAIAAWSDKRLPKIHQALSERDRNLAKARGEAVTEYLKTNLDVSSVKNYNMAETSNWLARTFRTSSAELKSLFSKKGAENPVTNAEFQVIKNEGGPREAVVVVERKNP